VELAWKSAEMSSEAISKLKMGSAALCREEIGPPGIPSSRPAWRWQILDANDAHFEF
jgi:hypothetical protein